MRLLRLEFKSDNITKWKATKFLLKKHCLNCVSWKQISANENPDVRKSKQNRLCCLWQEKNHL